MRTAILNGIRYEPCYPCADNDALAAAGTRLILRHGSATQPETRIFIAVKGELQAGWVIGTNCETDSENETRLRQLVGGLKAAAEKARSEKARVLIAKHSNP